MDYAVRFLPFLYVIPKVSSFSLDATLSYTDITKELFSSLNVVLPSRSTRLTLPVDTTL